MSGGEGRVRARGLPAALLVFAGALALFALLAQRTLHGMDSDYFVVWLEQGNRDYPRHVAYLHLCGAIYELVRPFGGGAFRALQLGSALGSAVGLALLCRAGPLLLGARAGRWLWLGALATPATSYYATCAEIPGVFLGGVGLSWWAFARWLAAPATARAAWIGAATGLTGALHSFGHLLPGTLVAGAALLGRRPARGTARQLLAAGSAHAAVALGLGVLLGSGAGGQAQDAFAHLQERWATFAPLTTPAVFAREWLLPFLPWSALGLLAALARPSRRWALVLVAGLLLHLPLCVLLLGHYAIDEQGAYLLALLPPAVVATVQLLPGRLLPPLALGGAVLSVVHLLPHWRDPVPRAFAAGVAELRAERPFLLVVGSEPELDGVRTAVPGLLCLQVGRALGEFVYESERGVGLADWFDRWVGSLEAAGTPVLLSASARRFLEQGRPPPLAGFWQRHVAARYRLLPERRLGFQGTWVRPR